MAYQLQGSAQNWWRERVAGWDRELTITWEEFRDEFLDQYFSVDICIQKENEFLNLTQGHHTVAEYETQYIELAEFAPALIPTEASRARRFEMGLCPIIRLGVRPLGLRTFKDVCRVAKVVEADLLAVQ